MPYKIRETAGGKWQLVKIDDGRVMGTHDSKKQAHIQEYAIRMAEKRRRKGHG
jgi:hypothetical protein